MLIYMVTSNSWTYGARMVGSDIRDDSSWAKYACVCVCVRVRECVSVCVLVRRGLWFGGRERVLAYDNNLAIHMMNVWGGWLGVICA